MKKIPVGATVAAAYRFVFGGIGTVIGLVWLPLVVYTLARYFIVDYYAQGLVQSGDPTAAARALLVLMGFWLVALFLTAIIGTSLTRQVIQPRKGSVIVQLAIGPAEFNYFLSLLAVSAILIAAYFALLIADIGVGFLRDVVAKVLGAAVNGRLALLSTAGAIVLADLGILAFIGVRLAFLAAPVTIAGSKIDLIRAWQLGRGNFWRMLAVLLVTIGPMFILGQVAFAVIVGPGWITAFSTAMLKLFESAAGGGTPATTALSRLPDIASKTPLLLGISFLLAPFTYGLLFTAPAFAYRALVGATQTVSADTATRGAA